MSPGKKLQKAIQKLFREILKLSRLITKGVMNWLLRSFMVLGRRSSLAKAGFILPTVVMVILVVTLLTTAILFRSFDRSKNASNVRVNEAVMQAATPAIDRAKTKIARLFAGPPKLSSTPADVDLYTVLASNASNLSKYTFGDETPLEIISDFGDGSGKYTGGDGQIEKLGKGATTIEGDETLTSAWRFPVDTNNDGLFDSYNLYAIYFRSPTSGIRNQRVPVEARNAPMDDNSNISNCNLGTGTSASLATAQGWYKLSSGSLKRSFFVYTAIIPITSTTGLDPSKYKQYTGNQGFSALEYEQDQARLAANNNAVLYDNDLEITPGSGINLNGRVMTNSNLITRAGNNDVHYYLVSAKLSCFYSDENNSRISVGGNVVLGSVSGGATSAVTVDLFPGANQAPTNGTGNLNTGTVSDAAPNVAYNSQAYNARINKIVTDWINANPNYATSDPQQVITNIQSDVPAGASAQTVAEARQKELETYFQNTMRRVPAKEVQPGANDPSLSSVATTGAANPNNSAPSLRPTDLFHYPFDPSNNSTSYNKLTLQLGQLPAVEPTTEQTQGETQLGDRILVGNALPAEWWDTALATPAFADATQNIQDQQILPTQSWLQPSDPSKKNRYRTTQFVPLSDLGDTSRGGFWEVEAAAPPVQPFDGFGGLRVMTGAGIYSSIRQASDDPAVVASTGPRGSFLSAPSASPSTNPTSTFDDPSTTAVEVYPMVWPDTMPQWEDSNLDGIIQPPVLAGTPSPITGSNATDRRGDLVMRATAVYHYATSAYDSTNSPKQYQTPIACVSSYYDPSTSATAINRSGLPDISKRSANRNLTGLASVPAGQGGNSWNGVSYPAPSTTAVKISGITGPGTNGLFSPATGGSDPTTGSLAARLAYQANLVFPNGRFVNEELRDALTSISSSATLTLDQQAAIDSTICALNIADGSIGSPNDTLIPHGAIYETTFLDARQLKAIDADTGDSTKKAGAAAFTALDINNSTPANRNNSILSGNYDLSIEERQPLEIRATVLDLDLLRQKQVKINQLANHTYPSPEYLLPASGIIYATRDDGLLDLSDPGLSNITTQAQAQQSMAQRESNSPVDFLLDPTRRPNGILLINGNVLARDSASNSKYNNYDLVSPAGAEKGLTLVSNLPAYVQADAVDHGFNIHKNPQTGKVVEEFQEQLATNPGWNANYFYNQRQTPEYQFACRANDPRLPKCTQGDLWRSTTVLADSVTLLSDGFRFGFRNEGDYDLRNNSGDPTSITDRTANGFYNNNFVTNGLSSGGSFTINGSAVTPSPIDNDYVKATANAVSSSYFNNFVTPIQRRAQFPEYIMEICRKLPVSECSPSDWVVGFDVNGNNSLNDPIIGFDVNGNGITNTAANFSLDPGDIERNIKANQLGYVLVTGNLITGVPAPRSGATSISRLPTSLGGSKTDRDLLGAGTTTKPPLLPYDQRYVRRVAFARNQFNELVLTQNSSIPTNTATKPLGVGCPLDTSATAFSVNGCTYPNTSTWTPGLHYGTSDPNSTNTLWFRTTNDADSNPVIGDQNNSSDLNITYQATRPLYYSPPLDATKLFLLPNVAFSPTVADSSSNVNSINSVVSALNGGSGPYPLNAAPPYSTSRPNTNRPLSAFAAYLNFTTTPKCSDPTSPAAVTLNLCSTPNYNISSTAQTDITNAIAGLNSLSGGLPLPSTQPPSGANAPATITITASTSTNLNVYNLPSNPAPNNINANTINANGTTITLDGNRDSVFVFNAGSVAPTFNGVTLVLNGVDPNNVFWGFYDKNVTFSGTNKLAGNFLGAGSITASSTTTLAGRLLGFANSTIPAGLTLSPMTSQNQPLLSPVLQLNLTTAQDPTNATTGNPNATPGSSSQVENTLWLTKAPTNHTTTFNLVVAGGDTPNRPNFPSSNPVGEFNGGLQNFVRFLENWRNQNNYISGSFIQVKRSAYATAPFQPNFNGAATSNPPTQTSLNGGIFGYPQVSPTAVGPVGTSAFGRESYYVEPLRNWGFDVGQLSQYPDLFSQRFTTPPAGNPNQFYREVGKDDSWVQSLLCAGVGQGSGTGSFTYGSAYASTNTTTPPSGITCPTLSNY